MAAKSLTRHEEYVLLSILNLKDNAYLVTIQEYLTKNAGSNLSFGTLYVSLKRLEKAGYLNNYIGQSTSKRGGKAIKYYHLTKDGHNILKEVSKINQTMWYNFGKISL